MANPARSITRFRAAIIIFWAVAVALAWPRAARVEAALRVAGSAVAGSESRVAGVLIREAFPQPIYHYFVVVLSGPQPLDSLNTRVLLENLIRTAASEPYVSSVVSFLSASDSML